MSMGDDSFETTSGSTTSDATPSGSSRDTGASLSGSFPAVDAVIAAFGGIRPMATKLGISFTTVQGWKTRGQIPTARWAEVEAAAATNGINLAALPTSPAIDLDPDTSRHGEFRESSAAPFMPEDHPPRSSVSVVFTTVMTLIIVALLAGGGGYATRHWWLPQVTTLVAAQLHESAPPASNPAEAVAQRLDNEIASRDRITSEDRARLEVLARQVTELEVRLEEMTPADGPHMEDRSEGGGETSAATVELARRMAALERAMTEQSDKTADIARSEALEASVRGLSERLQNMEKTLTTLEEQATRLGAAEKTLSDLEARSGKTETRLSEMEARSGSGSAQTALVFAVELLNEVVTRGSAPYTTELETAKRYAGDDDASLKILETMTASAAKGVPSREDLSRRFIVLMPQLIASPDENGDWWSRLVQKLEGAVVIRPAGSSRDPGTPEGRIAAAEIKLRSGDLGGAVKLVEDLPGMGKSEEARQWLADAKLRITVEENLKQLEQNALDRLGRAANR